MMPRILDSLAQTLAYRPEKDRRLEDLLKKDQPTTEEALEIQALLQQSTGGKRDSICGIAFLTGILGREAPNAAVRALLTASPPAERSTDDCMIGALMLIGPGGYQPLLEWISTEDDRMRLYIAVMALVSQTVNSDFPVKAGLGSMAEWDTTFPRSKRTLRRLATSWQMWWKENANRYVWNPKTQLLEAG